MALSRKTWVQVWLIGGLLFFAFQCGLFHVSCVDPGFHIRTGEWICREWRIPDRNLFSFSQPQEPWLLHQWLPCVFFYWAHAVGGVPGLIVFKALLGAAIAYMVWIAARQEAGRDSLWPFWAVTLAIPLARVRFFERPYLFSAILLAWLFFALRRKGTGRRWRLGVIPLMMAIWANTHAGVVYGFALMGAYFAGSWLSWAAQWIRARKSQSHAEAAPPVSVLVETIGIAGLSILAVGVSVWLIHPHGLRVLISPLLYFSDPFWRDWIVELQAPTGWQSYSLLGFIAALILLQLWRIRFADPRVILSSVLFGYLALRSQRSLLMFFVVATPHLAGLLESVFPLRNPAWKRFQAGLLWPAWLAVIFFVLIPGKTLRYGTGLHEPYYPMGIYKFMKTYVPPQRIYNDMMYGGGMLWFLYPDFPPFMDGRGEAYSLSFWRDVYVPVSLGQPLWREVFDRFGIQGALIPNPPNQPPGALIRHLRKDPDWALIAFDDNAQLFLKRTPLNAPVIADHEYEILWPGDWTLAGVVAENAERAVREARRALVVDPECGFAQTALARALLVKGDYRQAVNEYRQIFKKGVTGGNYQRDYGYGLYMAGEWAEAERIFQDMIAEDTEPAFAHYMLHFMALREGNLARARMLIKKAVTLKPDEESYRNAKAAMDGQGK